MSTTTTRRCVGSERFGIEAHEASTSEFPKQPSQPDGLGRMCTEHWKAYTSRLRTDALARKATPDEPAAETAPTERGATTRKGRKPTTKTTKRPSRAGTPSPKAAELEQAEALIAEVDTMPATEHVKRVGDADVQAALEVSATARMIAD